MFNFRWGYVQPIASCDISGIAAQAEQALAHRGATEIYSQTVREEFRLGPASSVQKAFPSLDSRDILNRYRGEYFFLDPLLPCWIRTKAAYLLYAN